MNIDLFPKDYCGRCKAELTDWLCAEYPAPLGLVCGECDRKIRQLTETARYSYLYVSPGTAQRLVP